MREVAYMLDTDIWKEKIVGVNDKVEYVVGSPSVELLFKAYNAKKGTDYKAQASSATGYQISKDGGRNWSGYYSGMLDTSESTFVIDATTNAEGYWLSSPYSINSAVVLAVDHTGKVGFDDANYGLRPVICLSSDVQLKEQDGGYAIEE